MATNQIIQLMVARHEVKDIAEPEHLARVDADIDRMLIEFGVSDTVKARHRLQLSIQRVYAAQEIARNDLMKLYAEALPA